jgi:hypothetical protein
MGFIHELNRTAKPFRWTYDGTPLEAADMGITSARLH